MIRFVQDRLANMHATPQRFAGTKEAFGLQLVLLAEMVGGVDQNELMVAIFGPGGVPNEDLDDAWAQARVGILSDILLQNLIRDLKRTEPELIAIATQTLKDCHLDFVNRFPITGIAETLAGTAFGLGVWMMVEIGSSASDIAAMLDELIADAFASPTERGAS